MVEKWPPLEFPPVSVSILNLFSRETSERVANALLAELKLDDVVISSQGPSPQAAHALQGSISSQGLKPLPKIALSTEDQLRWIIPVLNYSVSLPYVTDREYETVRIAVRVYTMWLHALTMKPSPTIPTPLVLHPEQYFRTIIDALRAVFLPQVVTPQQRQLSLQRQSVQIHSILDTVNVLLESASEKYRDEVSTIHLSFIRELKVWNRLLLFQLNTADIFLAEQWLPGQLGTELTARIIDDLFATWFGALAQEQIQSLSYWSTLSQMTRRWRHHVPVIEAWAKRLLTLTTLVCQKMYGAEYLKIETEDDWVQTLAKSDETAEDEPSMLFQTWLHFLRLLDSPASVLNHTMKNVTGDMVVPESNPLTFFLVCTALQRMIDLFYGDSRVELVFSDCSQYMTAWSVEQGQRKVLLAQQQQTKQQQPAETTSAGGSGFGASVERSSVSSVTSSDKHKKLPPAGVDPKRASDRSSKGASANLQPNFQPTTRTMSSVSSTGGGTVPPISALSGTALEAPGDEHPAPEQCTWQVLNKNPGRRAFVGERTPKTDRLLGLTMDWLVEAVRVRSDKNDAVDDAESTVSLSSTEPDEAVIAGAGSGQQQQPGERMSMHSDGSGRYRHSHAGSATSSVAEQNMAATSSDDTLSSGRCVCSGIAAGRGAALGALMRVLCAKGSHENIGEAQLARFLTLIHEALAERERVVLCSLIFYGERLFTLALPGVEILLPSFLYALDLVLIESHKLRLHPSFSDVEMRAASLRALATVVSWPTVFGIATIPQLPETPNGKAPPPCYMSLRSRIYKTLVFSLRHETDPTNLQLTFALCTILVEEACAFELSASEQTLHAAHEAIFQANGGNDKGVEAVSVVRGIISALCDRLCRPEWADFGVSLAAIDTLNAFTHVHPSILFSNKELSTGSLIVASLCRFIDTQLSKPPLAHSKDLHSSVVAAFQAIGVWLSAAPALAECESTLNTVANAIEFGKTGQKKNRDPTEEERGCQRMSSKRVEEAAEAVLYGLFTCVGRCARDAVTDERRLLHRWNVMQIDTTRFVHVMLKGETILSVHEASHIEALSNGLPTVLYVLRSPFHSASAGFARLLPEPDGESQQNNVTVNSQNSASPSVTSTTSSVTSPQSVTSPTPSASSVLSSKPATESARFQANAVQEKLVLPPDFFKATCKLDAVVKELEMTKEIAEIMEEVRRNANPSLERNIWAAIPEGERARKPKEPAKTCDSVRVFLHDLGLLERSIYRKDVTPLDAGQSTTFYKDLHSEVDSCPAKALGTAFLFYVKEGQRSAVDILENALNVQNTCTDFCGLLAELGEGIDVTTHDSWTGHASTAFSSERKPVEEAPAVDHYLLDGVTHALWWTDTGCELAFLVPSERSVRQFHLPLSDSYSQRRGQRSSNSAYGSSASSDDLKSGRAATTTTDDGPNEVFLSSRTKSSSMLNTADGGSSNRRTAERVMVVWVERADDALHFPIADLVGVCDDGLAQKGEPLVLFLHSFEPQLVRVSVRGHRPKTGFVGPLLDGLVVSLSLLPSLIRLTLLNLTRRHVVEVENFQATHTRRRAAITEFAKKYALDAPFETFLRSLIEH